MSAQKKIDYIQGLIGQKIANNLPCFYTIKVIQDGVTATLIERKPGDENFTKEAQAICEANRPDALMIELWKSIGRKVKNPESDFYIDMKGQGISAPVKAEQIGGDSSFMIAELRRNFDQQLQGVRELSGLHSQLTITQLELKHAENKIEQLEGDLEEAEQHIDKLERELQNRPQLSGPGGVNIIEIGSHLLEGVLRRNPSILGGALGMSNDQVKGLFTNNNPQALPPAEQKQGTATATVQAQETLSENDKVRADVIESIAGYLRTLPDAHLRKVYDLMCALGKDFNSIEKMIAALAA